MLSDYWAVLIGGGAAAVAFLFYYLRTDGGRLMRDRLLLRLPVIGSLVLKSAMSRFASIFSILQASGGRHPRIHAHPGRNHRRHAHRTAVRQDYRAPRGGARHRRTAYARPAIFRPS